MTARPPDPVIVVPGITASYLRDDYPLPPETVWSVMRSQYERVVLHPDDLAFEAVQPARIQPDQIFEIAYKELINELRHNLTSHPDRPTPVYPFSYDWRQPLEHAEADLALFIDEVIARTRLMRHYASSKWDSEPTVALVGHSMGGLIIAGCLESLGERARVSKVATLASPFQGSFEAVIKLITGTADLGTSAPSSREREAARLMPALYHLMPSFERGLEIDTGSGLPATLFERSVWQPSVLETLSQFVERHGLNRKGPKDQAAELFDRLLATAKAHRERLSGFDLAHAGLERKDWLCVVGAGSTTRVRLKVITKNRKPEFALSSKDRDDRWASGADAVERRRTGDGTVPLEGAVPKFLSEAELVVVTPDDFGYWEIGDRALSSMAGFHGILPNMDMLHRLIVRHFTGAADRHGNTWGRRMPGVQEWTPPLPLEEKD